MAKVDLESYIKCNDCNTKSGVFITEQQPVIISCGICNKKSQFAEILKAEFEMEVYVDESKITNKK